MPPRQLTVYPAFPERQINYRGSPIRVTCRVNPMCTEFETMDTLSPALPSVEAVLDKVKSDGTFDQFRKTCLAAVEAEVGA